MVYLSVLPLNKFDPPKSPIGETHPKTRSTSNICHDTTAFLHRDNQQPASTLWSSLVSGPHLATLLRTLLSTSYTIKGYHLTQYEERTNTLNLSLIIQCCFIHIYVFISCHPFPRHIYYPVRRSLGRWADKVLESLFFYTSFPTRWLNLVHYKPSAVAHRSMTFPLVQPLA